MHDGVYSGGSVSTPDMIWCDQYLNTSTLTVGEADDNWSLMI